MLRQYQKDALKKLKNLIISGEKRILLVSPTGSGKTVIAASLINSAMRHGKRILFMAHRHELISQPSKILDEQGIDHGILQGNNPRSKPWLPVQVATSQTLSRRKHKPNADIIILDEAHRAEAATNKCIFEHYPNAYVLGLTATPRRTDGKGLGRTFHRMIQVARTEGLIADGYLCQVKLFAPSTPDLSGAHTRGGDYATEDLSVMQSSAIVGDIIKHWRLHAAGKPTAVFAHSIKAAQNLCQKFLDIGVTAAFISGKTPSKDRERLMSCWQAGKITVMVNCQILVEGIDYPQLYCVINAAPTKSITKFRQMNGRAMRPHPSKEHAIILDHTGSYAHLGLPWEEPDWTLDDRKKKEAGPLVKTCPECLAVFEGNPRFCPECGAERRAEQKREVVERDGELIEIRERAERKEKVHNTRTLDGLLDLAKERGYKPGWAYKVHAARNRKTRGASHA